MEAEKRTNRASIDSEVFELPHSSFVLEPDYANIAKEVVTQATTSFFDFEKIIILSFEKLRKGIDGGWGLMIN